MLEKYALVVVCFGLALVIGCGTSPDLSEGVSKLQIGDSKQRVIELCGAPHRRSMSQDIEQWHYEAPTTLSHGAKGQLIVAVQFKDGKAVGVSRGRLPLN